MHKKSVKNSVLIIGIGLIIFAVIYYLLSADRSQLAETTTVSKSSLPAFNNPELLGIKLSDNGIGTVEAWKAYEEGIFMASSSYFQIGPPGKSGISNQLSCSIIGNSKHYVNYLEIILIVNNKDSLADALNLFKAVTIETFKDIAVDIPEGLEDAIVVPKKFSYDSPRFHVKFFDQWNGLTEWHLTIGAESENL